MLLNNLMSAVTLFSSVALLKKAMLIPNTTDNRDSINGPVSCNERDVEVMRVSETLVMAGHLSRNYNKP